MARLLRLPRMGALVRHSSGVVGTVQGRGLVRGEPCALVCAEGAGEPPRWLHGAELVVLARGAA